MKLTKKKVLLASLAVCLVAIVSFGTLAWFTAEDTVVNEFYVGNTTTDPDEVFGIDLWERANGVDYGRNTADTQGVVYEEILPGQILDKDPYLTNTGIHPMYVRAIVTVTGADVLYEAMVPKNGDVSEWHNVGMFLPGTGDKWTLEHKYYTDDGEFVFVYYYNEILDPASDTFDGTTQKIFDDVVIPTELTKEQAAELDNFTITIEGQAIQSEHLVEVTNAKEAFIKYYDDGVDFDTPITIVSAPLKEDFLFPAGTQAALYEDINFSGDAQIVHSENAVLGLSNVTAEVDHDFIIRESDAAICISDCDFTLENGAKLISVGTNGGAYQVFLINVTVNGELLTDANAGQYLEGVQWFGAYPEWP